jgi:uncharacterized protein (DUF305 family)
MPMTGTTDHTAHHAAAPVTGTTTTTGTTATTGTTGATALPGMMGPGMMGQGMMGSDMQAMMAEMMSMMGGMQGMMGPGMMGSTLMTGAVPMTGTVPMSGTMGMTGTVALNDCAMVGPMLSMMGSMLSMMGSMQTMQGMMAGHAGMMGTDMMGQGMMGSNTLSGTMPMSGTMMATGMMGMMGGGEATAMLDHVMQMLGQLRAMVTTCQQSGSTEADQAFDLKFIDSMIPHHEGAIAMAQQALTQAEHAEIKQMAQEIISGQQAEITQMQAWRSAWYPDAAPSGGMGMEMGTMEVPAGDQPFDLRFIDAMIPHHEGAIAMAQQALTQAQHVEIKDLAQKIVDAQQTESAQLKAWRTAWYPDAQ